MEPARQKEREAMETDRYYNRVAAAFVRGRLSAGADVDDDELLE